ncbi:YhdP family protein [Nitrosospira sp. Is2]|uniref:YhdP family protein n=1 Tax=Nitrosospira sp. Is2 TaxID=3080532 RepID=UPI002955623A|nr:YhdP family protein [Nitrosospira sp. Is2]WON73253.1 YhdP family protein [Nitrosospira sp. Is2]
MNFSVTSRLGGFGNFLLRLLTWVLIVIAASVSLLLLSFRYWLLPDIEQYRENIAQAISQASGQRLTIGEISANWDGLRPHIVMRAIQVHDKEGDVMLLLHRLEGTLSWRSIFDGNVHFREMEIDQPDLVVRRDPSGVIHVAGFALNKEWTGSENGFSDWLLNQRRVIIKNASILWQDDYRGAPELELLVNLRLENRGHHHRFGLRATPPTELAASLDLRGDLFGESLDVPEEWRGRLFTQIDRADIAAWRVWLPFPEEIQLNHGTGTLRMWASIEGLDMTRLTADMRLRQVKTQLAPDLPELNLMRVRGRVGWQKIGSGAGGFELFAKNLSAATRNNRESQPVNFSLRMIPRHGGNPASGILNIDRLNLRILGDLAEYLPLGETLHKKLEKLSPRGELHYMRAKWVGELSGPSSFSAKGHFDNLGMKKSEMLPAFDGITGNIDITERAGTLNLNSQNATVDWQDVFHGPLKLDKLTGQASWSRLPTDNSIALKFSNISFFNAYAAGLAHGNYWGAADGPGVIDMTGHLTRADARYFKEYLPVFATRYFPEWFGDAIVEGQFSDTRLHLRGNLADFPFGRNDGIFTLNSKVSGLILENIPEWPRIENIWGNVKVHGRRMEFDASQAGVLGATVTKASFHIADISDPDVVLHSEVEASGATRQFVKFAAQTMAKGGQSTLADDIPVSGYGKLAVQFDLPLQRTGPVKLSGNYEFVDNQLDPGPRMPSLTKINGVMAFNESGLKIENITARLLGGPVAISSANASDGSVRLSVLGKIDLDNLASPSRDPLAHAPQPWVQYLRGSTDWRASIHLSNKIVEASVESTLRGLTSDLPEPFAKAAADIVPLRFERTVTSPERDRLIVSYGSVANAKITRTRDSAGDYRVATGEITLGAASRRPTEKAGIFVNGALPTLNLDRWRSLLGQSKDEAEFSSNLAGIQVHVGTLDFLGKRFHDLMLNADKKEGAWHSTVVGNEINGDVKWDPSANGAVTARLHRLAIPAKSPSRSGVEAQKRLQSKTWPALDVVVDTFLMGDKELGRLELIAGQQENFWRVEKLHVSSPDSSITAHGLWQNRTGAPRVQADLILEASDIGTFLTRLGLPDQVRRGSGRLEGVLSWHGNPLSIDYSTLSGTFKLNAKRGQFPKFEPGLGRLFGIFNLQALPRRITLDFHDVFSEGLGFDDISGGVKIRRGLATTDDLRIEGPSVKIFMNGEMNLEAETQKLHIKVTPSYGLATPVVGMASVIANTALQKPATSKEYDITGSWTEPVVARIMRQEQEPVKHEQ